MKSCAVWILTSLLAGIVSAPAWAERTHEITIDDYFSLAFLTDVEASPNGKQVAYAEWRWDGPGNPRDTDLWVVDVDGDGDGGGGGGGGRRAAAHVRLC